jgi:hypothetical protein
LLGQQDFKVPPKVFGCVWFVKDHQPTVGKLNPQAVKCIFVGYASTQKVYKCWDPIGRRLFVSMDVTFREAKPYYTKKDDLDQFLEELSPVNGSDCREGEDDGGQLSGDVASGTIGEVIVGGVVPQDMAEVMTPEEVPNDEISCGNDDPSNDGHEEVEGEEIVVIRDEEVVVVGTIPCPTGDKKNDEQRETQPGLRSRGRNHNLNKLKLQS